MISLTTYLEDFGTPSPIPGQASISEEMLEEERLDSFDKGYRAGWEDAVKAKSAEAMQVSGAFGQNLQDLSFTYHEAHAQVLSNLSPLFDEILQKLLPSLARDTLGAHIAEQLASMAQEIGTVTVDIVVGSGAGSDVSDLLAASGTSLPISVVEVETLGPGQAEMRLGGREISVDLAGVTTQITDAVHAALHQDTADLAHG